MHFKRVYKFVKTFVSYEKIAITLFCITKPDEEGIGELIEANYLKSDLFSPLSFCPLLNTGSIKVERIVKRVSPKSKLLNQLISDYLNQLTIRIYKN